MCNTKQQLITVGSRHCKCKNENRLKAFVNKKYGHVKGLNFNIAVTKHGYKTVLFSMVNCLGNMLQFYMLQNIAITWTYLSVNPIFTIMTAISQDCIQEDSAVFTQ